MAARKKALSVADLMCSEVSTLKSNDPLSVADDVMRLGRIRHMPVVSDDDESEVIGVVSQRDMFRGALARSLGYGAVAQQHLLSMLKVKEVMTTTVETVTPETSLQEAAGLMVEHKIGCLIVVSEGRMVGIVTETDFVAMVADS
ncbi:MAG: CBS domain-containing protein [Deltaproteobacteria bacterium]|nr:CBS domain-containing protein [Deltaproteobacteria bacterium]MBW2421497.1 CBS domain-containing protein [Deltaproteobacteria bacterium]